MTSAKVTMKEQDRSAIVPSLSGVYAAVPVISDKGPLVPTLVTSTDKYLELYGVPNPRYGVGAYSALRYLRQGNKLWVTRATHSDTKHAAALVRSKIEVLPTTPLQGITPDHLIVRPLDAGLTPDELKSYQFPTYITNRLYTLSSAKILEQVVNGSKIKLSTTDGIQVGSKVSFSSASLSVLNDSTNTTGELVPLYGVTKVDSESTTYDMITLQTAVNAVAGASVVKKVGTSSVAYDNNPVILRSAQGTKTILVSSSDLVAEGDTLSFGEVTTSVVVSKTPFTEVTKFITIDGVVSVGSESVFLLSQSEFEDRDAFLVAATYPGSWGKDISVGIAPSTSYANAFTLLVYYRGSLVESWEVTRTHELDGFQRQLYLESKINGKSAYITVVDNPNDIDSSGTPEKPLVTDYSLWRQSSSDIFNDTTCTITENLLKGHTEVKLSDTTQVTQGDRIKFVINETTLSKEYKIISLDSVKKSCIIDRPIEESFIGRTRTDGSGASVSTLVKKFIASYNDSANGIINGQQFYAVSKLSKTYYNYPLNSSFTISGVQGTLLSAGVNLLTGGSFGSSVTIGDLITAINKLKNKEATPITMFMDGGFYYPAVSQAINAVCEIHGLAHGYLSSNPNAEDSVDYLSALAADRNSRNLNTKNSSLFAGWIKIYDEYNQLEVWTSPESAGAASQSFTTRNYNLFTPAAGYERGKVDGLDVKVKFDEGDRDYLTDNQINPIRYKDGSGLIIWGNETLLTKPSPMQLRSVAMLLIFIKYGFQNMLEFKTFDMNTERTWNLVEGALNAFMRDEVKAKDGVYDYAIAVKEVITPTDIDNRKMPVFLGIKPTMDIREIPVTLAIFNNSVDIEVSL